MRPGQNKRMRGRNNNNNNGSNRKGPNPLTRSYESNGPDVKIRGTAHHIGEKYLQLARDAQSSGDPVMAESYLQHAEHYFRLIASAQQAQQQAAYGYQRGPGDQSGDDDDDGDDDFSSLPDRFASPVERVAPLPPQPYAERPAYNGGSDRQPYEPRPERQDRQYEPRPHQERQTQGGTQERSNPQERGHQAERGNQDDRPYQARPERYEPRPERYDTRPDRNGRGDRPPYAERNFGDRNAQGRDGNGQERSAPAQDRNGNRAPQDRSAQDRSSQDRSSQDRPAQDGNGAVRDYDNRGHRTNNGRGPREFRNGEGPREPRQLPQPDVDQPVNSLPAFITAPVRSQPEPVAAAEPVLPGLHEPALPGAGDGDEAGFTSRPRRRRRTKAEFGAGETDMHTPVPDPAGE